MAYQTHITHVIVLWYQWYIPGYHFANAIFLKPAQELRHRPTTNCPLHNWASIVSNTRLAALGMFDTPNYIWLINLILMYYSHDDVIKWKHFPRNWPFVRGIHRSRLIFPHKGQWRGALMFSLICVWINVWVNNCEAGDLRRYRSHYDVKVMFWIL